MKWGPPPFNILKFFSFPITLSPANQVIRKVIPQIPVIDKICIRGRLPYCVYAMELRLP